jgi:hypothetical protein
LPKCCVLFNANLLEKLNLWLPDPEEASRMIRRSKNSRTVLARLGMAGMDLHSYDVLVGFTVDKPLNYTPCPACLLAKNFVFDVPDGCPCCQDEAVHPATGPLPSASD